MSDFDFNFFRALKFAIPMSLILWALIWFFVLIAMSGCVSVVPNYVAPEIEHMSHISQHEPLTSHPTGYNVNIAGVVAGYNLPHHLNLELTEGVALNPHYASSSSCGEIQGPREEFSARLRYTFQVRP